jgi:hypothetical protein
MELQIKEIPGYEGLYSIDENGLVYSHGRKIIRTDGRPRTCKPRILTQQVSIKGYKTSALTTYEGKITTELIHRLVAFAFYGKSKMIVDHIDGNKQNNHVTNLRYCKSYENLTFRNTAKEYKNETPNIYQQRNGMYSAFFQRNKKKIWVGFFKNKEKAIIELEKAKCLYEQQQ